MNIQLGNIYIIVFFVFVSIAIIVGAFWVYTTEKRLKKIFIGKKGKDLEDTIHALHDEIAALKQFAVEMNKELKVANSKLRKSIRGVETIRFNPFADQGSNQSFAIGMLNEDGDGVVLSSLYSRERMSVFAKPVKNHKSEFELTVEEKEALKKAEVK